MGARGGANSTLAFLAEGTTISPKAELRERIKIEFYKTYDVMTGIRIAATLGGFFSMMILLVLYKNYCKSSKTLSEEQLNAAVTAAAEEEDRALQAALEATSFYTALGKRQSLENTSQVFLSPRFSSVGGGYSHLTPPLKVSVLQQRGKSLPGSVMQFGSHGSPSAPPKNGRASGRPKEEDFELEGQPGDFFASRNHLNVPPSRRVSSVTCSSADSSYLERRCSAFELGLPGPPHFVRQSREKLLGKREEPWDFYYPIDIQVIQPTPEMSPTASERNLNEEHSGCSLQVPAFHDQMHRLSVTSFDIGLAPLASIGSLGSFGSQSSSLVSKGLNVPSDNPIDNQNCTCADDSVGSDSVFMDDIEIDDDDEFATDSEFGYDGFDDDYSFCETKQRPGARAEPRALQFASFDSYDASIAQDSVSEYVEEENPRPSQGPCKQPSTDLKRHPSLHEGSKVKRKLVKTYSEPRSSKIVKRLPPWTEKGRSGYVPRRQLSSPSARKKNLHEDANPEPTACPGNERPPEETKVATSQEEAFAKDFLLPSSSSSSADSLTLMPNAQGSAQVPTPAPKQGINKDLPFKNVHQSSLANTQEKRSRLQKQKNFMEDAKEATPPTEKTEERPPRAPRPSEPATATSGVLQEEAPHEEPREVASGEPRSELPHF